MKVVFICETDHVKQSLACFKGKQLPEEDNRRVRGGLDSRYRREQPRDLSIGILTW